MQRLKHMRLAPTVEALRLMRITCNHGGAVGLFYMALVYCQGHVLPLHMARSAMTML